MRVVKLERLRKLGGWRADNPPMQAAIGLVLVTLCRMAFTVFEEKIAASKFSSRRKIVTRFLRLMSTEGPERFRMMTALFIVAAVFLLPTELAYFGKDMAELRGMDDDA